MAELFYTDDIDSPEFPTKSIFLAGPSPRDPSVKSWRPEAIRLIDHFNFDGVVCIPEWRSGQCQSDYTDQINWEKKCLEGSTAILFWVPRELQHMPAFTTNVEFGHWTAKCPDKVFYGRPSLSPKNKYLDWMYKDTTGRHHHSHLHTLVAEIIDYVDRI